MFHSVPSRVREKHHDCLMQCDLEAVCYLSRSVHTSFRKNGCVKIILTGERAHSQEETSLGHTHLTKSLFLNMLLEGNAFAIFRYWPVLLLFSFHHAGTFVQFKIDFPLSIYHPTDYSELEFIFFHWHPRLMRIFQELFSTPQLDLSSAKVFGQAAFSLWWVTNYWVL